MKLVVNVKNETIKNQFNKNDVMLYDGKDWYITTVEDIYQVLDEKINQAIERYNQKFNESVENINDIKKDTIEFKSSVSSQLLEMAKLIKELYKIEE